MHSQFSFQTLVLFRLPQTIITFNLLSSMCNNLDKNGVSISLYNVDIDQKNAKEYSNESMAILFVCLQVRYHIRY